MKEKKSNNKVSSTPVMRQYWEMKKSYPDSVMLFRIGDFYETFEEDAKLASKVLGITLTKRANGAASSVPLAGFPHHALEQYVYKFLNEGHKVALCEQVEDPKKAKGIVKRSVTEVLTPGTAISSKYLSSNNNNYIFSLFVNENYFGYSILDNSTGEFYCGKAELTELNELINKYEIKEILVPKTQENLLKNLLRSKILITSYDDWRGEIEFCYQKLIKHFNTKSLKGFGIEDESLCIISAGVCIDYLETNYYNHLRHINSLSMLNDSGYMKLDSFTVKNLELFKSLNGDDHKNTLMGVINKTITSQGERLLKKHLQKPLYDKKKIKKRLNVLEEIIKNNHLNDQIRECLNEVGDIERILGKISNGKANPKDILSLAISLKATSKIKKITDGKLNLLKSLLNKSKSVKSIINKIVKTIQSDPSINILKGGYINHGIDKKLDEYRSISSNVNDWLVKYQIDQQKATDISSLKIKYNRVFGYYIDVTKTHLEKVPENYIRKQTLVNSERFYTIELKEYEEKILKSEEKIIEIEKNIFDNLTENILRHVEKIQFNSRILAEVDLLCSHCKTAIENSYHKPNFSDKITLELNGSRHPVVEKLLPLDQEFIVNDIYMNQNKNQIAIITGPNMAGKSTFLRQIGHIVILAQIGSYVPAEYCKISLVDQLFTRVGASDNISQGESTFLVEMNEASYILNNSTKNSFIILDEIGRGTSTFDGLALAWSITEFIHNNKKNKARTLFATHYHELIYLAEELEDAFNLNVEVKEFNDQIIFLRKIIKGGASKSYGIQVAKMAGMPISVIERAKILLEQFMQEKVKIDTVSNNIPNIKNQLNLFNDNLLFLEEIKKIKVEDMTPIEALNTLNELKKKYDN